MNRRGFLGSLAGAAALPTLVTVQPEVSKTFALPIGCDLSLTALIEVLNRGKENNYGRPLYLMIGPENLFPARELLGSRGEQFNNRDYYEFGFRINSALPMYFWLVQFEKGTVTSQGPY